MTLPTLPVDQVITGDCLEILPQLPAESVHLIFADPPYNLQLQQDLWRPNMTKVQAVNEAWDRFESFTQYDDFTRQWLKACYRVLRSDGSLWVIGTYHNIYRVGAILQELGFWILNDVIWIKTNPMPNFRGVRFTNAHETLIWACKSKKSHYTFNYHTMKAHNDGLQMRSDWILPICSGTERIKVNGKKVHPTQKPEALLYRVLMASTRPGDIVLDPFFGTGTTGAVAKKLHRHFIGIEKDPVYAEIAQQRIMSIKPPPYDEKIFDLDQLTQPKIRITLGLLVESGYLTPGQVLYFRQDRSIFAQLRPDGYLIFGDMTGSIHQVARHLMKGSPCNGWDLWFYEDMQGHLKPIEALRAKFRDQMKLDT